MKIRVQESVLALLILASLSTGIAHAQTSSSGSVVRTVIYAPQNRPDVRGTQGAVSAGQPLAAQAGLRVLQEGEIVRVGTSVPIKVDVRKEEPPRTPSLRWQVSLQLCDLI